MKTKSVELSKVEFFKGIRRPVFLMFSSKVERSEKGCGYKRHSKYKKNYETE